MTQSNDQLVRALADRYRIERELGHGGMAVVYLAHDIKLGRRVALKVLRPELASSLAADRFLREIAIEAPLVHPNIVALHESGEAGGYLYYVMPYVEGPTLRQRLERETLLPLEDAVSIARQIAAALDYAHANHVVHRDIKPENILLVGGHAFLADFGIARALSTATTSSITGGGMVVGTAPYMSPEQCSPGGRLDGRSDVYSLGCVVFEMIAGVTPFRAATMDMMMAHHLTSDPPSVCEERSTCPPLLDTAIRRALAKLPADRFRTAGEFAAALDRSVASGTQDATRPVAVSGGAHTRTRRWTRMTLAALAVGIGALVVAAGWALLPFRLGPRDWLLVADFTGPPDDRSLPVTVRELVTTELNQSRRIQTVSRAQLNTAMRLADVPETTHVGLRLARELAYRTAVRAIVVGAVNRLDDRYTISLYVVTADGDGREVTNATRSATAENLVTAIGDAVRELRQNLGERREDVRATLPLIQVATPSLAAYQHYIDGLARARRGDIAGGNALLYRALDLDTAFAAAWAAIGTHFLGARQLDSAQHAFGRALAMPTRLTEAQKYRLRADLSYTVDYDVPGAVRWYDLYLAEYPQSIGGRNNRALYVSALGRYDQAVADLKAAVAASPFGPSHVQVSLFNLVAMLVAMGRMDEANETLRDLTPPFRTGAELLIAVADDRWAAVRVLADSVDAQRNATPFLRLLATTARVSAIAASGARADASGAARAARGTASAATARWYDRADMLLTTVGGERPSAVPPSATVDSSLGSAMTLALRAAMAGDTTAAHRHLARIRQATPKEQALLGHGPLLVRGWIAAAGGRWADVTRSMARAAAEGEHDSTLLDRVSSLEIRWLVANAYAAQGKRDSAELHLALARSSLHVPAGHLVLRGLASRMSVDDLPFATSARLALSADSRHGWMAPGIEHRDAVSPSEEGGTDANRIGMATRRGHDVRGDRVRM